MIDSISRLKKHGDLLNSEGTILGLFSSSEELVLSSFLKHGEGEVFYTVARTNLALFLQSKITLEALYLLSNDFLVLQKFRNERKTFLKTDLAPLIEFGVRYFSDFGNSMKDSKLVEEYCR